MALPENGRVATKPLSCNCGTIFEIATDPAFPGSGNTFMGKVGTVELSDLCNSCTSTGIEAVNVSLPSYRALSPLSRSITSNIPRLVGGNDLRVTLLVIAPKTPKVCYDCDHELYPNGKI